MSIRGILLCGGRASRFGSDKLLAEFRGEPLVAHAAKHLLAGCGNALAVIPPGASALRALLEACRCQVLESPRTANGLGASLAAAVAASAGSSGWIVALGDMPAIQPSTIGAVRTELEKGALVCAPAMRSNGARGHPVGFAAALRDELCALGGDEGARSVIQRHRDLVVLIEVDDDGILVDVDTPEDLSNVQ